MATKEQLRKIILEVAGNPSAGIIVDLADEIATAIAALDAPPSAEKETRIVKPPEMR